MKLLDQQQEKDSQHYLWDKLTERQLPKERSGFLIRKHTKHFFSLHKMIVLEREIRLVLIEGDFLSTPLTPTYCEKTFAL